MNITGKTHLITLIGKPTDHSASPASHSLSFDLLGIDTVYLAFDVEEAEVGNVIAALRAMDGWDGSNVTMPLKQAVIPYLDDLSDAARLMGAVNVIEKRGDALIGHNTDGFGFMENLRKHGFDQAGKTMTLVGAGGAGSAILVQAALDGIAALHVFVRAAGASRERIAKLIPRVSEATGCAIELHDLENIGDMKTCIATSDVLVNATNVGMGEGCTDTPIPADCIKPGMLVSDIIYLPRTTQLLKDAAAKGCTTVEGIGMLNEQGAAGEKIWYGVDMPLDEVAQRLGNS